LSLQLYTSHTHVNSISLQKPALQLVLLFTHSENIITKHPETSTDANTCIALVKKSPALQQVLRIYISITHSTTINTA
jgi:hypothetical protein